MIWPACSAGRCAASQACRAAAGSAANRCAAVATCGEGGGPVSAWAWADTPAAVSSADTAAGCAGPRLPDAWYARPPMKSDSRPCWTSDPATAGFTQVMVTVNSYTGHRRGDPGQH